MSTSKLKMNPKKTEFNTFGSKQQRDKLRMSAKVVLCRIEISDMSGSFLLIMLLYLWLILC